MRNWRVGEGKGENQSGRFIGKDEKGKQTPCNKMGDWLLWRIVGAEKFPVLLWVRDFPERECLLSRRVSYLDEGSVHYCKASLNLSYT